MKLMKVRANDAQLFFTKLKIFIPNIGNVFEEMLKGIFSIYELEGYHYMLEVSDDNIEIADDTQGRQLFRYIASNCYLHILPFVNDDGGILNVSKRIEKFSNSGNSSANANGTSNNKNMSENAPINESIDSINSPTYKSKNINDFDNNNSSEYQSSAERDYISPDYIREYEKINTKFTEVISADIERFIYEIRMVY